MIYIYIYDIYMYDIYMIYTYIHIYTNLPVSDIVRLPHPRSGDGQRQETFLKTAETCFLTWILF